MAVVLIDNMAFTIAIALVGGLIAQTIARHLRIPGIVLLLAIGALLGPDGLKVIDPGTLGPVLHLIVGFAVAIILFEGGMNLNVKRLLKESTTIQRLITLGSLITAVGGTVAAKLIMGWSWPLSIMFGTLVIVTGPTVITPLLRRIKVNHNVHTILEAEGVLIDPIGAIIAIVALEIIIHPSGGAFASGLLDALIRIGVGAILGLIGGYLLSFLIKRHNLIGEGLENVFVLAFVIALYTVCNEIRSESGIAAVAIAGVVVGNIKSQALRDLMDFKEQLTVMLIALLFVLLAADVRLADVQSLGWPGILTVVALMLIIRPLNILACTYTSKLSVQEKIFLSWLAPRGIVAAAFASFAAITLNEAGIEGADSLRALVFLVIAITVLFQGLTGEFLAAILKVKRPTNSGYSILGANELARVISGLLKEAGEPIVLLDSNPDAITSAEKEGHRVVFGNALEERTLQRANLGEYATCIAMTTNEEVNLLFVNKVKNEFKLKRLFIALHEKASRISADMLKQSGAQVLFGQTFDIALWSVRVRRDLAAKEDWIFLGLEDTGNKPPTNNELPVQLLLPLRVIRNEKPHLFESLGKLKKQDIVTFLIFKEDRVKVVEYLHANGWKHNDNSSKSPSEGSH